MAQLPVILAARHRLLRGEEPVPPTSSCGLVANLLWMLFHTAPTEQAIRAMDISLILYAEHDFNASTFTARVVASTLSDLHSAVTAAIAALKGPLHGGANERAMEVLREIGTADKAEAWIRDVLARKAADHGLRPPGLQAWRPAGHLAQTNLRRSLPPPLGTSDMERLADIVEHIVVALKNICRQTSTGPCPGFIYYLGLPIDTYTPLFVVSRVTGWSADVIEQLDNNRLIRPLAKYTGRRRDRGSRWNRGERNLA